MERLTPCELAIMQVIWKNKKDIPESEIKIELSKLSQKEYARTTIATFLKRLENKNYLEKYHVGRKSYVRPLISSRSYGREQLRTILNVYYDGDRDGLLQDVSYCSLASQ